MLGVVVVVLVGDLSGIPRFVDPLRLFPAAPRSPYPWLCAFVCERSRLLFTAEIPRRSGESESRSLAIKHRPTERRRTASGFLRTTGACVHQRLDLLLLDTHDASGGSFEKGGIERERERKRGNSLDVFTLPPTPSRGRLAGDPLRGTSLLFSFGLAAAERRNCFSSFSFFLCEIKNRDDPSVA